MTKPLRGQHVPYAAIDDASLQTGQSPAKANDVQVGGDHYKNAANYNHWDLATDVGMRHLEGAATKYLSRFGNKAGESAVKDLNKARHYVYKLIEVYDDDRIEPLDYVQDLLGIKNIDTNVSKFLDTLTGPPSSDTAKNCIRLLSVWDSEQDLRAVLHYIDALIEEHEDDQE